jgi:hypothetical protein
MRRAKRRTIVLGDLITVAFDEAAQLTGDVKRRALLASEAVSRVLCETGHAQTARRLARAT